MDHSERLAAMVAEVGQVLQEGLASLYAQAAGQDLGRLEVGVQQLLRQVGGRLVSDLAAWAVAGAPAVPPRCATCAQPMRRVGLRARQLVGLVGEVRLQRPYFHCAACGTGQAPADAVWGLDSGRLTPGLARVAARDGLEAPFDYGASLLEEHLGVHVDKEVVRRLTEQLGHLADADQAAAAPAPVAAPATTTRPRAGRAGPPPVVDPLVVELDGGMVHLRRAWSELKAGRVAPLGPKVLADPDSGDRYLALGPSCYCAGVERCDDFWPRLVREAVGAGLGGAIKRVVVLADGAPWIWHQARCQLGLPGVEVIEILDFYHASQHLAQVAAAVYGAESEVGQHWLDRQCHALRHQGVAPVLAALDRLHPRRQAAAKVLRLTRAYLADHAQRADYPAFRARLLPIGSGAIEGTVKNLIQAREVLAGMRWTQAGAHAVANLRALHRSPGRWTRFWQSRPLARAAALHGATAFSQARAARPAAGAPVAPAPAPATPAQPTAPPLAPPVLEETLPSPTAPRCRTRIQSDGKPWGKGKDYWRRVPVSQQRSA
jgi:hypothetical protein